MAFLGHLVCNFDVKKTLFVVFRRPENLKIVF